MSTNEVARVVPQADITLITQPLSHSNSYLPVMAMEQAIARYNAVLNFTQQIMKEGKDYGRVPGTDKPTLLKPGAEKLCSFFGLTPRFTVSEKGVEWGGEFDGKPAFFFYTYKCQLYRNDVLIGEGEGSCNSHESKYRYRWVPEAEIPDGLKKDRLKQRDTTVFEPEFAIKKKQNNAKYGKDPAYWKLFQDAVDSGTAKKARKKLGDREYDGYEIGGTLYRIPNPDVADQVNTIQKMAQKRAFIAATLIACNASEYYTQDVEDLAPIGESSAAHAPSTPDNNSGSDDFGSHDTGGHPAGTQAAADHVADQKLADLRAQNELVRCHMPDGSIAGARRGDLDRIFPQGWTQNEDGTISAIPASAPVPPAQGQTVDSPRLIEALKRLAEGRAATQAMLDDMRREAIELGGDDAGVEFTNIMGRHAAAKATDFKTHGQAKNCVRELFTFVRKLNEPPLEDDAKVPDGGNQ